MMKGKSQILLICGRQIFSKWSKNSSREAIRGRRSPQFVVTSGNGTIRCAMETRSPAGAGGTGSNSLMKLVRRGLVAQNQHLICRPKPRHLGEALNSL